ncbi:hypothetical protein CCR80_00185 [Rhodothalassium salexigens]|nr:hypothetical protein [Rhodothalassium salexigens]
MLTRAILRLGSGLRARWTDNRPELGDLADMLRNRQFIHLVEQIPLFSLANAINACLLLWLLWGRAPAEPLALWALAIVGVSGHQLWLYVRNRHKALPLVITARPLNRAMVWSLVIGAIWGLGVAFLFPAGDLAGQLMLILFLGGTCAGVVALAAPLPMVTNAFLVTALGPVFVRLVSEPGSTHLPITAALLVFTAGLVLAARSGFETFVQMIRATDRAQTAHSNLVDALECSSKAFAVYDRQGRTVVRNRLHRQFFPGDPVAPAPFEGSQCCAHGPGRWLQSSVRRTSRGGIVEVHGDVTQLKDSEAALREARDAAAAASQLKSHFLSLMSHELRTPLNAIIGFAEVLRDRARGGMADDQTGEFADLIVDNGRSLLTMVNDVLELSRVRAGAFEGREETVEMHRMVARAIDGAARPGPGVEVAPVDLAGDLLVRVDRRALRTVLDKLLERAVTACGASGRVTVVGGLVEAGPDTGGLWLTVDDTGAAPTAEEAAAAQTLDGVGLADFARDLARTGGPVGPVGTVGTGGAADLDLDDRHRAGALHIGLSLAAALMAHHGGHLTLTAADGGGARAHLVFPAERVRRRPADAATADGGRPVPTVVTFRF